MDDRLFDEVVRRLDDDAVDGSMKDLVVAAILGEDALAAQFAGSRPEPPEPDAETPTAPAAYLSSISVQGFRGVGPKAVLELSPGPGLTLVVGRNGSGKSSFAEALEILLTGENQRWSRRSAVWREGWRNLHHDAQCQVEAVLALDGSAGPTTLRREWEPGDAITDGTATAQTHGEPIAPLSSLGWDRDLSAFRPFLSYNELGSMLEEGPSKLFDALASILGLEDLTSAEKRLGKARSDGRRQRKETRDQAAAMREELGRVDDPRARTAVEALAAKLWDLAAIEEATSSTSEAVEDEELAALHLLVRIAVPSTDEIGQLAATLREAQADLDALEGTDAAFARQVASILTEALEWHDEHADDDCPVCGTAGVLDGRWRSQAEARAAELAERAEAAEEAYAIATQLERRARGSLGRFPEGIEAAASIGHDVGSARAAWTSWLSPPEEGDLLALAGHLEQGVGPLVDATQSLVEQASREIERREDLWRPYAEQLRIWLPRARAVEAAAALAPRIEDAEGWIKAATAAMREERFAPIRGQAQTHWSLLSQASSVTLDDIRLEGAAQRRRVELDVSIDGIAGAALGVMSQGELHSLALSLFLPRAMLPESPFRFVVIDDPVQAMDPVRVDGLALVLQEVAASRQVVVFSHDDRLPEAVRRLQIGATVLEVTRRPQSVVDVRVALDPVDQALSDARTVAKTESLPVAVAQRVVPGLCRQAIEAACAEVVRRRRIGHGRPHIDVEAALADVTTITQRLALALFDDDTRGGDVATRLNREYGRWAGDIFFAVKRGSHGEFDGDYRSLIRDTESLTSKLRQIR